MRKRDFVAIANAIADARARLARPDMPEIGQAFDSLSRGVADTLARQSGTFARARFLRLAGMDAKGIREDISRLATLL